MGTALSQPGIYLHPLSQSVSLGANVAFQVAATTTNGDSLAYQWRFNALEIAAATNRVLRVSNAQLTNVGGYDVVVTDSSGSATSRVASLEVDPTFTKITTGAIVNDTSHFIGAAWGDFNNDRFLDLVVSCNSDHNFYYRNNGDGTFTPITQGDPLLDTDYHIFTAAGDYNNDGFLDLVVSAGINAPSARHNLLYQNNGDGSFSRVSGGSLTNLTGFFGECAWVDYDNDGLLDLFVIDVGPNGTAARNVLWHNNGDGTFTRIQSGPLYTDLGHWSASWADYDNDGAMDVLLLNESGGANHLYHNDRNGVFTRVLTNVVATDLWPAGAHSAAWGDYDNDGFQDVFVLDIPGVTNRLYRNNGDGTFSRVTSGPMLTPPPGVNMNGAGWGDYDNDGYLDLFVSGDGGRNALYHNNGNGTFTEILSGSPVNDGASGTACDTVAWVDYDNDGFLDLFVSRNTDNLPISNLLYHNNGNTNAWLEVKLVGTASNRSAYGAKVRAHATIGGKTFWQMRELHSGGVWSHVPLVAHFGLGDATNVDLLRIEWPSGIVQTLTNVGPTQILTVVEHQSPGATNRPSFTGISRSADGAVSLSAAGDANLLYLFQASTNLVNWSWLGVRSNATGNVGFVDASATNYAQRFYRLLVP
jgi:hypothetical protein